MEIQDSVCKTVAHRRDFVSKIPRRYNFEIVNQNLVPWEKLSHVLEPLHEFPRANRPIGMESTKQRTREKFFGHALEGTQGLGMKAKTRRVPEKSIKPKLLHSTYKWKHCDPFWHVSLDLMGLLPQFQ